MIMKKTTTLIALAACMVVGAIFSASASADVVTAGEPTVVSSSTAISVVAAMEVKSQYDHVGTYIAVAKSKINRKRCFWSKDGQKWTNSMYENGTSFVTYKETTKAKFCKLKKPIRKGGRTWYYVKVAGGASGKHCDNLAVPPGRKQPKPKIRGKIMDYKVLTYEVTYELKGSAILAASAMCVSGSSWASATAMGSGSFSATVKVQVKAKSRIEASSAGASSISVKDKQHVKIKAEGNGRLDLSASATASCNGGKVYICPIGSEWNGERCAKNGETTPGGPIGNPAPGPNPNPSPDDPAPGPNMCFKEDTGQPVPPIIDPDGTKRCPAGTWGA